MVNFWRGHSGFLEKVIVNFTSRLLVDLLQKQPFRGVLIKGCFENMQQTYRRTPVPKCDFNKVALRPLSYNTSGWLLLLLFTCRLKDKSLAIIQLCFFLISFFKKLFNSVLFSYFLFYFILFLLLRVLFYFISFFKRKSV